ncbi:M15 family metallopeptidase [Bacillus massiliigorillae]|uniref:M15 family metallopeptidase n=1 Tax=Bacillus massiliigorillae TaxID=1243664 RepID=UPI000399C003|nr:M15 family metallopeptidase [Bacillus massiliigorillae]
MTIIKNLIPKLSFIVVSIFIIVGCSNSEQEESKKVASHPSDIAVLINKEFRLPENYVPNDLVYPDVPFIFNEKIEKRQMRKEPAEALKRMFEAAKSDGIHLAGVSGYRSEAAQTRLYNNYVSKDGVEEADRYSARPGHSEHQTGLSIDVSGITGEFAVEDQFANTEEAKWLDKHAHEYGFIIRFPKGKEDITGYKYKPWHIRYVGKDIATEIHEKGITLEEYYGKYSI